MTKEKRENKEKKRVIRRLKIIKGQVDGLAKLIEKEEDCQKITVQFYAVEQGLKKCLEMYLKENMTSCLKSLDKKAKSKFNFLLKEIIKNN